MDQKPQLQKDREDEKAEGYVPDEGTRKNPSLIKRKTSEERKQIGRASCRERV